MSIAIVLHVLSAVVWVGGMFFAYVILRPVAADLLETPMRLRLWRANFQRFFPWVWAAVVLLPATGYWIIFAQLGGMGGARLHIHIMQGIGLLMIALYLHLYFAPYRRLARAVAAEDYPSAGKSLNQIRFLIGTNLLLGLAVVAVAAGGRYL
jgi:uncharacterized membrane protein